MENKTAVLPIVRWGISKVASHQIGLVCLAYYTQPGQSADQATESPIYGFSPDQLRALAQALTQTADQLEASAPAKTVM
ncbi:MAG: hypothetical protein KA914_12590 [Ottowia sp.]|nr:hypothetical protein [Ottowia sp.]